MFFVCYITEKNIYIPLFDAVTFYPLPGDSSDDNEEDILSSVSETTDPDTKTEENTGKASKTPEGKIHHSSSEYAIYLSGISKHLVHFYL